jgi:hypothetical protein
MTLLLLLLAAAAAFGGVVALGLLQTALAGACFVAASVLLVGSTLVHHLVMIDKRLLAIRSRIDSVD